MTCSVHRPALFVALLTCLILTTPYRSFSQEEADPYAKRIKGPSDEGLKAIPRIRTADKLKVDLWAAEPLLANPVAFCFDGKGRAYVAETYRLHAGVTTR